MSENVNKNKSNQVEFSSTDVEFAQSKDNRVTSGISKFTFSNV